MEIVSLSNHIIRKALRLTLNEMAVLCDIKQMSQNPEYGYWCVKSKDKIADWLDLSRATVFNILKDLEVRGYIEKGPIGVRPTSFIYQLDRAQEEIGLYLKSGDLTMITQKISDIFIQKSGAKIQDLTVRPTVQNLDGDSLKFRPEQSKNYTQDTHIDTQEIHKSKSPILPLFQNQENPSSSIEEKPSAGQKKIQTPSPLSPGAEAELLEQFEAFRKIYRGTKRGLQTELENLKKKNPKTWKQIIPLLLPRYQKQIAEDDLKASQKQFVPQPCMLAKYINERRWEQELAPLQAPFSQENPKRVVINWK